MLLVSYNPAGSPGCVPARRQSPGSLLPGGSLRTRPYCAAPMPTSLAISDRRYWDYRRGCRNSGTFDAGRSSMNLTPRERDKLLVSVAAIVAERRLRRGVKLNYPEAVALITDYVLEGARDGKTVAELMRDGATVIAREQVMEGIAEMIHEIQVEPPSPDGTKLVTVHQPIR